MLRFAEIGFFIAPFALYATWLVMGSRAPRPSERRLDPATPWRLR